ncbi:MAG: DNA topoisomerase IV subunit A [Cyclobacteriaceae bacterium]|nr:MAG: DNA topoisomerase IV subunit A [Cyclobacteriaceae bacterium]
MKEENRENGKDRQEQEMHDKKPVSGMYENWFLDYASYVILERAVPAIQDGLKPVQRRILHAMREMDDGRYNKVANVIGTTMQFHPHGDASIGDAMVHLGQKDLLIDTQGNWGDIRTGDSAAAARYIEARLSKFALEVVFNPKTTEWQLSYDGRKKEPVTLPIKFPLLLAQGVEGIAVGLSTRILPHNFCELCRGSIEILKGRSPKLLPDFPTGGTADFSEYNKGKRGGKVRVRAIIEEYDKKTLIIKEIPFGTTTSSLIDSIIKANDKGKIKIKKVVDNTAQDVEILVSLAPGQSPDITIDALYAFTNCEVSISPNACVIIDDKPHFLTVNEILRINTDQTVELLKLELEIRREGLLEKILFSSLEKIFIENRIYRDIEECETWQAVISTIDQGLEPFKKQFYREITEEDIVRLTEIKIKRISRYDSLKADELMKKLQQDLEETEYHLKNLTEYAIAYFKNLLEKYGADRERKTEIKSFDNISAQVVAANNVRLYVNRKEGFIGYGLRKDEFVTDCSDLDDVLVLRKDGICKVSRISDKVFMGKDILYVGVFKKNDERQVYNMIYLDGKTGRSLAKRFQVLAVTRDKEYDLTKGTKGSKVLYLTANHNAEAESVTIYLTAGAKARKKAFDFDFSSLDIKGRGAGGNIITRYPVRKVSLKSEGTSTMGGLEIWYDETVGRLNRDQRGIFLGKFHGGDRIVVLYKDGTYELTDFELTNRYEPEKVIGLDKVTENTIISAVHYEAQSKVHYLKRFHIETTTLGKRFSYIGETAGSKLLAATTNQNLMLEYDYRQGKSRKSVQKVEDPKQIIEVKGWKANGNRFSPHKVIKASFVDSGSKTTAPKETSANQPVKQESTGEVKSPENKHMQSTDTGFQVGSTIEFDVNSPGEDQLGLFEQKNEE